MRATIYQPQYFPRLHYFNRILTADVCIILDSAQYTRSLVHIEGGKRTRHRSFQSDAVIKWVNGPHLLTIPIRRPDTVSISEARIDNAQPWARKHLQTIQAAYRKAPYFTSVYPAIEKLLGSEYLSLGSLTTATILWGIDMLISRGSCAYSVEDVNALLNHQKLFRLSRILSDRPTGVLRPEGAQKGTEWTAALCQAVGADEYMHGGTALQGYMDDAYYRQQGIKLVRQEWQCREYPQLFTERAGFVANLSILDLLFNVSPSDALAVLV